MADIKNDYSTGLISGYMSDDTDIITDLVTASGNDLVNNNDVTTVTDIQGNAGDFENSGSANETLSLASGSEADFRIGGDMTICGWITPESVPTGSAEMWIVNKYQGSSVRNGYGVAIKAVSGAIHLNIRFATTADGFSFANSTTSGIIAATRYWVCFVFDTTANKIHFYVNNVLWGSVTPSASLSPGMATGANEFVVGGQSNSTAEEWDGRLAQVLIYDEMISSGYRSGIYNAGAGVPFEATASPSIKEVNGLAIASVKSRNGLAIASVKSINGLSNV